MGRYAAKPSDLIVIRESMERYGVDFFIANNLYSNMLD